jgi:predicted phosphodiesterase
MRIVCISDTHDRHHNITVPAGDVLIHAGDLTMDGSTPDILRAFTWLAAQPHERIIVTPGNHDFGFQQKADLIDILTAKFPRVEVLIDRETTIEGLRVFASPYQPWFYDWAYNFARGEAGQKEAIEKWSLIPDDTAILITHGPVRGILDRTMDGSHAGCPALKARMETLHNLRLHVCGHIHEAYGTEQHGQTIYVNASSCDIHYSPSQPPIVIDLTDEK